MDQINEIRKQLDILERKYAPIVASTDNAMKYSKFDCDNVEIMCNECPDINTYDFTACKNVSFISMRNFDLYNKTLKNAMLSMCQCHTFNISEGDFHINSLAYCEHCEFCSDYNIGNVEKCEHCYIEAPFIENLSGCRQSTIQFMIPIVQKIIITDCHGCNIRVSGNGCINNIKLVNCSNTNISF